MTRFKTTKLPYLGQNGKKNEINKNTMFSPTLKGKENKVHSQF